MTRPAIPPTLWVDFNAVRGTRVTTTLLNSSVVFPIPDTGDTVVLQDDDGSRCWAKVLRRDEDHLMCQLELDTWRDPAPKPIFEPMFRGV